MSLKQKQNNRYLLSTFSDLGANLAKRTNSTDRKRETDWSISLAHHLLKELSVNQHYRLYMFSKFKKDSCSCCNEPIGDYGEYDDCSLGKLQQTTNFVTSLRSPLSLPFLDKNKV